MQVQSEIRKGAITVFITKYSGIFIGLIVNSILARLLSPAEFGIVGVVSIFIIFFAILSDIEIGVAIIQNQSLTEKETSDIFKISIPLSLFLALSFYLVSFVIAKFYSNQQFVPIGQLLSINVFFSSLSVVPKSLLSKSKSFKTIGIMDVVTSLVTGVLAIVLATKGWSYYSIVLRSVLSSIILYFLYLYFSRLKIQKGFSIEGIKKIGSYSLNQFAFNFINYFSRNLDNILIGKFMGNQSLGIYNQAYQLMMYPVSNLTHVITPVLHPILAKYQNDKETIYIEYLKVVQLLAVLGIPISIFVFFSSNEIIILLLGNKWIEVIPILRILSISIWIQMILSSTGAIFQAAGRTDLLFFSGLISAFIMVLSILLGIFYFDSLQILSYLLVLSFSLSFFVCFYILINHLLKQKLYPFYLVFIKQVPASLTMIVIFYLYTYFSNYLEISDIANLFIKFAIAIIIMACFHIKMIRSYKLFI